MLLALGFIVAVLLIGLGGFMAALDAAISSLSRADIDDLADGARFAGSLRAIAADPGAHLNAVVFVRVTSEMTSAVLITLGFSVLIEPFWLVLLLSALIMTGASFVLTGASPRSVGRMHSRPLLRFSASFAHAIRVLLGPVADALVAFGNWVTPSRAGSAAVASEEQLLSMVDEATELDVLEEDDRELIHSIFEFNQTVVREVMVPRTDMVTLDVSSDVDEAMSVLLAKGVSRVPVVNGDVDDVVGIVYLRDVARHLFEAAGATGERTQLASFVREPAFVPESQKADALLSQMQAESTHLAMVVDEYGGIAGLVTMEDLIEELVGDIADEYDRESPLAEDLGDGRYRVSVRLPIDELGELFDLELDDNDVDSVGGLVAKALGRLPVPGSLVRTAGLLLTAERTEGRRRRLSTVIVQRAPQDTLEEEEGAS